VHETKRKLGALRREVGKGLVGQQGLLDGLLTAVLAGGHVLIEGVPGLAKTRAVNLLAQACDASFRRVQFTPDLLPADIVGTRIYNRNTGELETRKGPVFAQFVLADEINRAAPKVQSALLEAMQERQVTLGDETLPLPAPFFVFATQNPVEQHGTYPLPEAQLDRFLMKLVVGYPRPDDEHDVVRMVLNEERLPAVDTAVTGAGLLEMQAAVRRVPVTDRIVLYATRIVAATRAPASVGLERLADYVELGASPRGSISLVQVARAHAVLQGRERVLPEDIKAVAPNVLRHRILLNYHAEAEGIDVESVLADLLGAVPVA